MFLSSQRYLVGFLIKYLEGKTKMMSLSINKITVKTDAY